MSTTTRSHDATRYIENSTGRLLWGVGKPDLSDPTCQQWFCYCDDLDADAWLRFDEVTPDPSEYRR